MIPAICVLHTIQATPHVGAKITLCKFKINMKILSVSYYIPIAFIMNEV